MTQTFVNLHQHSSGSFLDGFCSVDEIAARAKKIGMTAVGLTDHGEVNQHIQFQQACQEAGIKPIFGIEGYLTDTLAIKQQENKQKDQSHICLFAENETGLRNLWALSTRSYAEQFYYKALLPWSLLAEHSEGLIATDGCMLAYMAKAIEADDWDRIAQLVGKYLDTFGEGNFFIELHTWQFCEPTGAVVNAKTGETDLELNARMTKINKGKVKVAEKYGLPLIVVNDAHYTEPEDWDCHRVLWNMSTSGDDKTEEGQRADWLMTEDEVRFWMSKHGIPASIVEDAIKNTALIAERCNVEIKPRLHLPSITGTKEGDLKLFMDWVEEGFQRKVTNSNMTDETKAIHRARIDREVAFIIERDLPGYFLIVADIMKWCKNRGMLIGPSRGSSAGCDVAWVMDINEIDPIKYDLIFERFLNEGRAWNELPDIDIDIPQSRRSEVIAYIVNKYGKDSVCSVGTLSRAGAKQATKDLCRALKIPYADADKISKIIGKVDKFKKPEEGEEEEVLTYEDIIRKQGGDLLPWVNKYPELFSKLKRFIGLIRQSGVHASGLIISDRSMLGDLPLRRKKDGDLMVSQFENSEPRMKTDVAWLGFVKMDFLGLRHLDTVTDAAQMIEKRHGVHLDNQAFYNWPDEHYRDMEIYEAPGRGDTLGLFQIETPGGTKTCAKLKPRRIEDYADLVAANRPGVIDAGMLDEYIERRHGRKPIKVPHPIMKEVLKSTYGVVIYQEQVIELVQKLAGYTLSEADGIRKAMGKKLKKKMDDAHDEFIARCASYPPFVDGAKGLRGTPAEIAQKCWDNIEPSAGYSFGKGHATGYAMIGCWEAWLKYYYPKEYSTALLRTDDEEFAKTARYLGEIRKHGTKILPPDINESESKFSLTDAGVRFGITSISGVGDAIYKAIETNRPFPSLEVVLKKLSKGQFNEKTGRNLISIGALDSLGDRTNLLTQFCVERKAKNDNIPDFSNIDVVSRIEKELTGSYITRDPLDRYAALLENECLQTWEEFELLDDRDEATIGGMITEIRYTVTKKEQKRMAILSIDWRGESFRLAIFPKNFEGYAMFLEMGAPVIVQAEKLKDGGHITELIRLDRM